MISASINVTTGKHLLRAPLTGTNPNTKNAGGVGKHLFAIDYLRIQKRDSR